MWAVCKLLCEVEIYQERLLLLFFIRNRIREQQIDEHPGIKPYTQNLLRLRLRSNPRPTRNFFVFTGRLTYLSSHLDTVLIGQSDGQMSIYKGFLDEIYIVSRSQGFR